MNDAIGAAVDARQLAGAGERVNDADTESERAWSPYPALAQIVRVLRRMGASEVDGVRAPAEGSLYF